MLSVSNRPYIIICMKTIYTLIPLLVSIASAHPIIEIVHDVDSPSVITAWHRAEKAAPQPVRSVGKEPIPDIKAGDMLFWDRGVMPKVGDWFVADYPNFKLYGVIREAKKVTSTTVTTLSGTTIPLTQVQGTARRIIRVVP